MNEEGSNPPFAGTPSQHTPMSEEKATFTCPFCNTDQPVTGRLWEVVFAQVLMHFSRCAPPSRYPDTAAIMDAAEKVANRIAPRAH